MLARHTLARQFPITEGAHWNYCTIRKNKWIQGWYFLLRLYFIFCICMCACVWIEMYIKVQVTVEVSISYPGTVIARVVSHLTWVLGPKFKSSAKLVTDIC